MIEWAFGHATGLFVSVRDEDRPHLHGMSWTDLVTSLSRNLPVQIEALLSNVRWEKRACHRIALLCRPYDSVRAERGDPNRRMGFLQRPRPDRCATDSAEFAVKFKFRLLPGLQDQVESFLESRPC